MREARAFPSFEKRDNPDSPLFELGFGELSRAELRAEGRCAGEED
jgi:hypothetical protein